MTSEWKSRSCLAAATLAVAALGAAWSSIAVAQDEMWRTRAQIYGWFPSAPELIDDAGSGLRLDPIDETGSPRPARTSRFGLLADQVHLNLESNRTALRTARALGVGLPGSTDNATQLRGSTWTVAGSYAAIATPRYDLHTLAGLRYLRTDSSIDVRTSTEANAFAPLTVQGASVRPEVWDAVLGVHGRVRLGDGKWFAPYYFDVGAGQSDLTWQAFGGIGYAFSWGEVIGSYRYLDYNFSPGSHLRDLTFSGPSISFGIRF